MPLTWKANMAYQRLFFDRLMLGINVKYAHTFNNYHYVHRNLAEEPAFQLGQESNRPVFVPTETIDPETGRTNPLEGRITNEVGRVLELASPGEASQRALILEADYRFTDASSVSLSYAYNDTENNSNYQCCLSVTSTWTPVAEDPRALVWGPSHRGFRHRVVAYGVLPELWGFRLSGRYVGQSGSPFSLMVNGDINGDGTESNDIAYVFDPDDPATPTEVAEGIRSVMDNPDSFAADCIRKNIGRIAGRNSCQAPWRGRIDLRLSKKFETFQGQSAELVLDIFNFANLLNPEWGGQYNFGTKETLLNVEGFDTEARAYEYSVNENVGVTRKGGAPYQVQLGVRYAF